MELDQIRFISDGRATISALFRDNRSECFCLEDEYRAVKVAGETRIPAGRYAVAPRKFGTHYERYIRKFAWHRGMLEIMAVPGFTDILYHIGNRENDTAGCVLPGETAVTTPGAMAVLRSTVAYKKFYLATIDAAEAGNLWVNVIDRDRAPDGPAAAARAAA